MATDYAAEVTCADAIRNLCDWLPRLPPTQRSELLMKLWHTFCFDCGAEKVERQVFCGSIMECVNCDGKPTTN